MLPAMFLISIRAYEFMNVIGSRYRMFTQETLQIQMFVLWYSHS